MAVFTKYVMNWIRNFSLLPENLHCCLLGVLIVSTLFFLLLLFVLNVVPKLLRGETHQSQLTRKYTKPRVSTDRRASTASVRPYTKELKASSSWRYNAVKFWPSHGLDYECVVPCIKCNSNSSDKLCRYVLCITCCQASSSTVCTYHENKYTVKIPSTCSWFGNKPTKIDLSYSSLDKCPERVGFIGSQLHTLNLSNNNLSVLPMEIVCLLGLQHLDLHNNSIKHLPDIIGNFVHLKELDLSSNSLTELPPNIGSLKRLQELRLCNNHLTQLPATLGLLRQLQKLYVSKNRIEVLPDEVGQLLNIEVIQLRKNNLHAMRDIMGQLIRLEALDVSCNHLTHVPNSVTRCPALTRLRLQNNKIRLLPNQIGHLHQLRDLNVDNNTLRYLPASLYSLQLYVFSVEGNPLIKLNSQLRERFNKVQKKLELPSLVELCARDITLLDVNWRECHLPATLKDLLASVNYCRCCEMPVVDNCSSQLVFRTISGVENVPLCQHTCGLYSSHTCSFIQIDEE